MRIENEFLITESYRGPVDPDALKDAPSVSGRVTEKLVRLLSKEGFRIVHNSSEQEIEYEINLNEKIEKRRVHLPFGLLVSETLKTVGYMFRAPNLELTIRDYHQCSEPELCMEVL